jgi:hypothetical protein
MTADRKSLIREYKERRKAAGVFRIRNSANGKLLLGSSLNLEGWSNRHKFQLAAGMHPNGTLQEEWNAYGPEKFIFEVLEEVKVSDDPDFSVEDELTLLEQIWWEKLEPVGDKGYNPDCRIRQP